jgi:tRNA (guanine-N7-)-methyltransferase
MVLITIPNELPYQGIIFEGYPFFFRPKMRIRPELESSFNEMQLPLNHDKVAIEYCSGNGHWIIAQAKKQPDFLWIAVEKRLVRAKKILDKVLHEQIKNVFVVCAEAQWFTRFFLKNSSTDQIFINFPDPWPKDCHADNRLFDSFFVQEMARVMKPRACIHLVTDDLTYLENAHQLLTKDLSLKPLYEDSPAYYAIDLKEWGYSFFAQLWHNKGKKLYRTEFEKATL